MDPIQLLNCQKRKIWPPPGSGPADVDLVYAIGGAADAGIVRITADSDNPPPPTDLPTGSSGNTGFGHVTALYAHYMKSETGPPAIGAAFTPTPSP